MWLVNDVADAIGLVAGTKNRLLDHFVEAGKGRISLRELMNMCLDGPMDRWGFKTPPLWRVNGIGRKGLWSVVNGLTNMDLGNRCNEEWRNRLVTVKQQSGIIGATPYSSAR